jgi:DtxR family Mn-dependent transcriptional regulator
MRRNPNYDLDGGQRTVLSESQEDYLKQILLLGEDGERVSTQALAGRLGVRPASVTEMLGYGWDQVHEEAERLEHVISELFESRIAEAMGHPTRDPHGDPIPTEDLRMPPEAAPVSLAELPAGESGTLARVGVQDRENLDLLARLGLAPGSSIEVIAAEGTALRVRVGGESFLLPGFLAERLWMEGE